MGSLPSFVGEWGLSSSILPSSIWSSAPNRHGVGVFDETEYAPRNTECVCLFLKCASRHWLIDVVSEVYLSMRIFRPYMCSASHMMPFHRLSTAAWCTWCEFFPPCAFLPCLGSIWCCFVFVRYFPHPLVIDHVRFFVVAATSVATPAHSNFEPRHTLSWAVWSFDVWRTNNICSWNFVSLHTLSSWLS